MQLGFYFDQSRCTGCFTCAVACKDWHDIPAGPVSWRRVATIEAGRYPDVSVHFLSISCCHCAKPSCLEACPVGAITKRPEDGIVLVDREACLGVKSCGSCQEACPYGCPQFEAEPEAKMQHCTLCPDRWQDGKKPICVQACPMRALDAGPLDELERRYGRGTGAEGFEYDEAIRPSIIFKAKK